MRVPNEWELAWAAGLFGAGARVHEVRTLHTSSGPWWLRIDHDGTDREAVLRLGDPHSAQLATVSAALRFAAESGIAAPRLLGADLDGEQLGRAAVLESALPGNSDLPAGAGHHPGVDLGQLRMQMAHQYGLEAADHVLDGWEQEAGREAVDLAYGDAVAALNTPADMAGWPAFDERGQPLDQQRTINRRDAFLRAALARL